MSSLEPPPKGMTIFDLRKLLYKDVDDFIKALQGKKSNKEHLTISDREVLMLFGTHMVRCHPELFPKPKEQVKKEDIIKPLDTPLIYHPKY